MAARTKASLPPFSVAKITFDPPFAGFPAFLGRRFSPLSFASLRFRKFAVDEYYPAGGLPCAFAFRPHAFASRDFPRFAIRKNIRRAGCHRWKLALCRIFPQNRHFQAKISRKNRSGLVSAIRPHAFASRSFPRFAEFSLPFRALSDFSRAQTPS